MKKIIPCLDVKGGHVVKGVNFVGLREIGEPTELARYYEETGADELVMLDISKTEEGHQLMTETIKQIAETITMPLSIGGGISSLEDIGAVLEAGAQKASINSAAIANPELINKASEQFGSEAVTIAIDVSFDKEDEDYFVYTKGGKKKEPIKAFEWIEECERRGAGSLLITSIDHDGVKEGFDLPFLKKAAEKVTIPIIASGGVGKIEDFVELFSKTKVSAALAASIFHDGEVKITELKQVLKNNNIEVK